MCLLNIRCLQCCMLGRLEFILSPQITRRFTRQFDVWQGYVGRRCSPADAVFCLFPRSAVFLFILLRIIVAADRRQRRARHCVCAYVYAYSVIIAVLVDGPQPTYKQANGLRRSPSRHSTFTPCVYGIVHMVGGIETRQSWPGQPRWVLRSSGNTANYLPDCCYSDQFLTSSTTPHSIAGALTSAPRGRLVQQWFAFAHAALGISCPC